MGQHGPILVVAAGIVKGNHILLARREEPGLVGGHLKWELPGGKVQFGETPEEALRREIYEELGLKILPQTLIPYIHTTIWEKAGQKRHYAIVCYQSDFAEPNDFSLARQLPSKAAWFKKDEIDYEMTLPGTREFVEHLSLPREKIEEVLGCLVRLEPIEKALKISGVEYVEIHILPNILADMWDSLSICVIIKRRYAGRVQLPQAIQPYIYKVHRRRAGLSCKLINKESVMGEFVRIVGEFKRVGYSATKFHGHSIFLRELEVAT